jgi:hypothetical protein
VTHRESWTGKFLDPSKVASGELRICDPCWDDRNRPVDLHGCIAAWFSGTERGYLVCHCPCEEMYLKWDALRIKVYGDHYGGAHTDLDSIDLDHDLGIKDLTSPFGDEY